MDNGTDPALTQFIGYGQMKVIAFITEHEMVDAILRHLERKDQRRERAPPSVSNEPTQAACGTSPRVNVHDTFEVDVRKFLSVFSFANRVPKNSC